MNYKKLKEQIVDKDNTKRSISGTLFGNRKSNTPTKEVYDQVLKAIKSSLTKAVDKNFKCGTVKNKGRVLLGAQLDFSALVNDSIGDFKSDKILCSGIVEKDNKIVLYFGPESGNWRKINSDLSYAGSLDDAQSESLLKDNQKSGQKQGNGLTESLKRIYPESEQSQQEAKPAEAKTEQKAESEQSQQEAKPAEAKTEQKAEAKTAQAPQVSKSTQIALRSLKGVSAEQAKDILQNEDTLPQAVRQLGANVNYNNAVQALKAIANGETDQNKLAQILESNKQ